MPYWELSAIFLPWAWNIEVMDSLFEKPRIQQTEIWVTLPCMDIFFKKNRKCFITIDLKPQTCFESNSIYFLFVSDFPFFFF